jgi:hypothetical protein
MSADIDFRVEKVARALCRAAGEDPEKEVQTGEMEMRLHEGRAIEHRPVTVPGWHRHVAAARWFVAAFDALAGPPAEEK